MNMKTFVEEYAVDRKNTNSLKWDALDARYGDPDLIAMWVADMEFKIPKEVQSALHDRVDHGVFGYSFTPDSYYHALIDWQQRHHGATIEKDWVRFSTGIVTALYWFVNIFTEENDAVMIQTPVYYPFHNAVKDNNRRLVTSQLINTNGHYTMDLQDFEEKIKQNNVKMFILCSPHNPTGRVWTEAELTAVLEICHKHQVLVISDEIHQDIVLGGRQFISSLSVAEGKYQENMIVCTAPSKTFNLACLLNSHIIIPSEAIRAVYDVETNKINQTETSIMGQIACEAAYTHGDQWLEGLLSVVEHNFNYLKSELNQHAPQVIVTELEGTYLAWLDLRAYVPAAETKTFIQDKCRLAIDFGEWFGEECHGFVRLNMGTDPKYVKAGIANIINELKKIQTGV